MLNFIIILLLAAGVFGYWQWSKWRTRSRLLATPLSDRQRAIVAAQVPLIRKLPRELRGALEGKIGLFLHQIDFVGCNGLDVTEEMRLSIAAQACLLVVNTDMWYDQLSTVLIYPDAFKSQIREHQGYVVTERESVRTGESWACGPVVLSWADTEHGALDDKDGYNVVLHEFAHQIDALSGHTDGAPMLNRGQSFADWERVFLDAYERHVQNVENGQKTVLDDYGAVSPEELFAVAVEVFFEKPAALKREELEVYQQLSELFCLDPATWS